MEKLFSLEYGIGGICVILTLMTLMKVGEFLWKLREKKESVSEETLKKLVQSVEQNSAAMAILTLRLRTLEDVISDFPKIKIDIRRSFAALKELAGDEWPKIREEIVKEFPV